MRRIGPEVTAMSAMALTAGGEITRAFASTTLALLGLTGVALVGVALGNVGVPPLVKRHFPDRIAAVSTAQLVAMHVGAIVPALAAVPLADATSWWFAIGCWSPLALAACGLWLWAAYRRPAGVTTRLITRVSTGARNTSSPPAASANLSMS